MCKPDSSSGAKIKMGLVSMLLQLCLLVAPLHARAEEIYAIDGSPLFLYKTINWWYDSPAGESGWLCGKPISCRDRGNGRVTYDDTGKRLKIELKSGFGAMLLAFKTCGQCFGPSQWRAAWLNGGYFGKKAAALVMADTTAINGFTVSGMEREAARRIQGMALDLGFALEGRIGGLANGRIALYASDELLKQCSSEAGDRSWPMTLKIINTATDEVLARFDMAWKR